MNFCFLVFGFLVGLGWEQSDSELFGDIFGNVGVDGGEHDVQYRAQVRWTSDHGLWVANRGVDDLTGGCING